MAKKYVYLFSEGDASMRNLLGGKGANLAEMTRLGMPVPQGFTVTTEACTKYYEDGKKINDEIQAEIMAVSYTHLMHPPLILKSGFVTNASFFASRSAPPDKMKIRENTKNGNSDGKSV